MRIGFFHHDHWPLNDAPSIQSWQYFSYLSKHHQVFTDHTCPFPGAKVIYRNKGDVFRLVNNVDVFFIIVDGIFDFQREKFALFSLLKKKKTPVILLINAPLTEAFAYKWIGSFKYRIDSAKRKFFGHFADGAICVSKNLVPYTHSLGIQKTIVVSNGSDPDFFSPSSKKHYLSSLKKYFKVIWSGGGEANWHALDIIKKLAEKCEKSDPNILFIIVTNKTWLDLSTSKNILVVHAVPYDEVREWIHAADLCLCLYHDHRAPNDVYGFYNSPMKLFDYMAMAKPLIASNKGQISEIIHDEQNGFLTNNTLDDLTKKILYLKKHPSERKKIGAAARKTIKEKYSWDKSAREIEKFLSSFTS